MYQTLTEKGIFLEITDPKYNPLNFDFQMFFPDPNFYFGRIETHSSFDIEYSDASLQKSRTESENHPMIPSRHTFASNWRE